MGAAQICGPWPSYGQFPWQFFRQFLDVRNRTAVLIGFCIKEYLFSSKVIFRNMKGTLNISTNLLYARCKKIFHNTAEVRLTKH